MSEPIIIKASDPRSEGATALLRQHHALMNSLYPAESNHYLGADALAAPHICFLLATRAKKAVGCAAIALYPDYGEIKSMFVAPDARGANLGSILLEELETIARAKAIPRLLLETGDTLHAAHKIYQNAGFTFRGPFADYPEDPNSRFMEKQLS
ncbi:MAG: putative acetyltransferase [Halocynthiibacter sp.]